MANVVETLKEKGELWQNTFIGDIGGGKAGYRGDLILVRGKLVGDKEMPPEVTAKQCVAAGTDSFEFFAGSLEKVEHIKALLDAHGSILPESGKYFLFIINADQKMNVFYEGRTFHVYPLDESTVWNEMLDIAGLEKSDFKGLGGGEKVAMLANSAAKENPALEEVTYDAALTKTSSNTAVRYGAV